VLHKQRLPGAYALQHCGSVRQLPTNGSSTQSGDNLSPTTAKIVVAAKIVAGPATFCCQSGRDFTLLSAVPGA